MSSVSVRLKYKTLNPNLRLFSSSSSSSSPLPPPTSSNEEPQNNNSNNTTSACFRNIESSLRQVAPTERRIPLNPPKPDIFSTPNTQRPTSLDEIRSKLGEFRLRSAPPSSSPISFQDLYKSNVVDKSTGGGSDDNRPPHYPIKLLAKASARFVSSIRLRSNLKIPPFLGGSSDFPLPRSIFGRELDKKAELEKEGISVINQGRTDFVKEYGSVSFKDLRDSLKTLRDSMNTKRETSKSANGNQV